MTTIKTILTTTAGAAILALGSLLWGCSTDVDEQLNGTWVGEEIGYDSGVWTFELGDGNADVHAFMDGVELEVYVGTYSTRSGAGLPRVDFHIDSSDVPSYAGETAHCVYDVLGDELSLACYEPGESGYPDSLEPGGGARAFVLSLVYEGGDDDDDVVGDDDDVVGDDDFTPQGDLPPPRITDDYHDTTGLSCVGSLGSTRGPAWLAVALLAALIAPRR